VDQFALSAKWWCYAVESWVLTANTHPMSGISSPLELVTGETVDISATFQFSFDCPVTSTNIDGRDQQPLQHLVRVRHRRRLRFRPQ
jgi:hypothetical protein